ncbi:hypothetical protein Ana3638_17645 [Anaerocolumna sedimenticola]|uniref:Uncharacterized protein n=1 Tax=Anaerocolumna sedimenticola TaxID=2696063 RepID=A0A6P1TR53_9FIRM|nr:hypothetical protein [Anaerocolumna sedimenticola]QHQ62381.1 hypothetical protein Ana3638_17645 [Anaerocolumna sedimenticola]
MKKIRDIFKYDKLLSGYRKFYTSILLSFILSLILPVLISGIILYVSLYHNAKNDFYKTHEKQISEITSYIWQTTNNIETDLSYLKTDTAFRNYRKLINDEVKTSVSEYQHIANNLLSITSKYSSLYSIYFYDKDFDTIYNTDYGSSTWDNFHDTDWIKEISNVSRVQRLKPRINMNLSYYKQLKPSSFLLYKPQQVLSLVCQANTTKMFVANISIADLYNDLVNLYSLNQDGCLFYIIDDTNQIIYAQNSNQINTVFPVDLKKQKNLAFSNQDSVYFASDFYDGQLYCVISYPIATMNTATNYFADYVILICICLLIFLVFLAKIVSKKLYHPIDDLYKNIQNTFTESVASKKNIKDEIAVLKETFQSLNANNSSMNFILSSYETIVRNHNLKMYFEGSLSYEDLVDGNKVPYINIDKSYYNQLILFRLPKEFLLTKSVHEMSLLHNKIKDVMNTYIKNAPNGFFIHFQQDTFLAFISIKNTNALQQLKQILYTVMEELLEQQVFCIESNYIRTADELLPSYHECVNAMKHAVFFGQNEAIIPVTNIIKIISLIMIFLLTLRQD